MRQTRATGLERVLSAIFATAFGLLAGSAPVASAQPLTFTDLAGGVGGPGSVDGPVSAALFRVPTGVAVDRSGNIFVADQLNSTIRRVSAAGFVSTVAGLPRIKGRADGTGAAARFNEPEALAVDGAGNLWVADTLNQTIRKVTPGGVVTTVAGLPETKGSADGAGSVARFSNPAGIAVDAGGNLYVADRDNHTLRKVTPGGVVTTLAGQAGTAGSADGAGAAARFSSPADVAVDGAGYVYVADMANDTVRKVSPSGDVTTLAGSPGNSGSSDGTGSEARFSRPSGVTVDVSGNVYVGDTYNQTIRKVTPGGVVTTLATVAGEYVFLKGVAVEPSGSVVVAAAFGGTIQRVKPGGVVTTVAGLPKPKAGSVDGTGSAARFDGPLGVALDGAWNVYVADANNNTIRKMTAAGVVTTLAGLAGSSGSADGVGSAARFNHPYSVAADRSGNLYVADKNSSTVRKVTAAGVVTTLAGLAGSSGSADGTGSAARFDNPEGIAVDAGGNLFVSDGGNRAIRKVTPGGVVTTLVSSRFFDGRIGRPVGIAVAGSGIVYVADSSLQTISAVTPAGDVTTLAGYPGKSGEVDGTGSQARFKFPAGIALDGSGNLYVTEAQGSRLRKVTPAGVVTTVAGLPETAANASVYRGAFGVAADGAGNVYTCSDAYNVIQLGRPTLADVATVDTPVGRVGEARQLDTAPRTATSWLWEPIRIEGASNAPLPAAGVRNPTFTPDVPGHYVFRLTATDGKAMSVSMATVRAVSNQALLPLSSSHVWVQVDWKSQYTGASGTASAIPKGDAYGFFYFSDPVNPEVFVKVLDFGADRPYLLFWAGLTDLEYTVTFTNPSNRKSYNVTKPAGSTAGGANAGDLPHARAAWWDPESGSATEVSAGEYLGLEARHERMGVKPVDASLDALPDEPAAATQLLLDKGQISVTATWWSQYTSQSGTATALPQDDQFGFFFISEEGNPEIFVKSLDWGKDIPFLLFGTGLTDYQYTVTYTNVKTGQKVVFTKPAGGYQGFADGTQMKH